MKNNPVIYFLSSRKNKFEKHEGLRNNKALVFNNLIKKPVLLI